MDMEFVCMKWVSFSFMSAIVLLVPLSAAASKGRVDGPPQFTAFFSFGDSLIDPGNNNNLNSLAKANYVPYGIDVGGPSGRFSNGKIVIDYIGELLGIPVLPAYANPSATGKDFLKGVNYASAAGGILEETGRHLGERFSLSQQINNFKSTLNQLREQIEDEQEFSSYLSRSLVMMIMGSNDYLNNYLQPSAYSSSYFYSPKEFAELLINRYSRQILGLRSLGLRKFLLAGIGPLGCIPNQLATGLAPPGKCIAYTNQVVGVFNNRLVSLVDELNSKYSNDSVFAFGNTFGAFADILTNFNTYGFNVINAGCCGVGRNRGQITCLPFSVPCSNRNQYVFWDAFHPTQAVHQILAQRAYAGSTAYCYPVNIQQMAQM